MFDENNMFRVISVHDLCWEKAKENVKPRFFNALSFRVYGNTELSSSFGSLSAKDGDILLVPENVGYAVDHGKEHIIAIHFLSDSEFSVPEVFSPTAKNIFSTLFSRSYEIWHEKRTGYIFELNSVFNQILKNIAVQKDEKMLSDEGSSFARSFEYLKSSFCDRELCVSKLCTVAGMSGTYYRSKFEAMYGTTPLKYITALRIDYSKELLASGYYSVVKISEMCGFSEPKYFSTCFKKVVGCSPSAYCEKIKGPSEEGPKK